MKRPQSVTVFGILNIVFGAIGLVGLVINLATMNSEIAQANPVLKMIQKEPVYRVFMEASVYVGSVVSLILIVAGIGLLNLKPWARKVSIVYAIYAIAMSIVGGVMSYLYLLRPMLEQAGGDDLAAKGAAMGGLIGAALGMVYPILLLIFMLNGAVAAAFRSEPPPQVVE